MFFHSKSLPTIPGAGAHQLARCLRFPCARRRRRNLCPDDVMCIGRNRAEMGSSSRHFRVWAVWFPPSFPEWPEIRLEGDRKGWGLVCRGSRASPRARDCWSRKLAGMLRLASPCATGRDCIYLGMASGALQG